MQRDEGVGKGIEFQPQAHRGASLTERHQMASGLVEKINAGDNMSPKDWMQVIHHMSQTDDGQRYANMGDIDMKHGDWNKPIPFSEMREHVNKMTVDHGTHGDAGKRGFDKLTNKLEGVHNGSDKSGLKFKAPNITDEGPTPETNYGPNEENTQEEQGDEEQGNDRRQQQRDRQQQRKRRVDGEAKREQGYGPDPKELAIMNSYQASVTDTFKRAFKITI
jgi:hypothetical protein